MGDYSVKEVADQVGVGEDLIYKAIEKGDLRAYRPGKKNWRITPVELARFKAARENHARRDAARARRAGAQNRPNSEPEETDRTGKKPTKTDNRKTQRRSRAGAEPVSPS